MDALAEAMDKMKRALQAEYDYLIAQGFTSDEAIALMRQREIEAAGW
jgi:cobalamin biosynthesis Co2+ chelatase CbiK